MNLIGTKIVVENCTDPTKRGLAGEVLLETANMLLIDSGKKRVLVEKKGSVFIAGRTVVTGEEIMGRLQDRLRSRR